MITNIVDPVSDFETKNAPEDPSVEDQESMFKMKLWELKAKNYLEKEETIQQNVNKLYAIIIGQCSPVLKSVLKADGDYTQKSNEFDALWLLKKLKVISAGVDLKVNPLLTLQKKTINFFSAKKGFNESDDDYLVRFESKCKKLELAGGEHIFYSPKIVRTKLLNASVE